MRKIKLVNEKYYHVFNRGANKQEVFLDKQDYLRFLRKTRELNNDLSSDYRDYLFRKIRDEYYQEVIPDFGYPKSGMGDKKVFENYFKKLNKQEKLVEIVSYCVLPNHYHFILKQIKDGGVESFMRKLGISYAKYFNHKYKRSGVLFQGRFQAFEIKNEDHLAKLSAYVNCNYQIHKLGRVENWQFSSYLDCLNLRKGNLCNKNIVLELFDFDVKKYIEYCKFVIKDSQDIKKWQKILN